MSIPDQNGWEKQSDMWTKVIGKWQYWCGTKGVSWFCHRKDLTCYPVNRVEFLQSDGGWTGMFVARPCDFTALSSFECITQAMLEDRKNE